MNSTSTSTSPLVREQGSFLSHVLMLVTGTALSQIIGVAAMLLLTRLFAPEAFGLLALFMTIASVFSVLGGGRYELAIMLPERDTEAANVFWGAVLVLGVICGVCFCVIAVFPRRIAAMLGEPSFVPWLWLVPPTLFTNGLNQVLSYWCGRTKRFRKVAFSRVAQAIAAVVVQVGLYLQHASGGAALIWGWILGQAVGTGFLVSETIRLDGRFLWRSAKAGQVLELLRTYRNFAFYKAPYSFISNASSQLVIVVLRFFSDLGTVGLFSMANRAVFLPVTLISSSINQVFYQRAATEQSERELEDLVNRILRIQIVLMTPLLIFAAFDSKFLFGKIFGARWTLSGEFAAILAFAGYMYFLVTWLDRLFDVRQRQKLALALEVVGNVISLGALAAALLFFHRPVWGIAAFSLSEVVYCLVWLSSAYRVAGFSLRSLSSAVGGLVRIGLPVLAGLATVHLVLEGWAAVLSSAVIVVVVETTLCFRYVRRDLNYRYGKVSGAVAAPTNSELSA
jgi:lipopolysaccharide exporter